MTKKLIKFSFYSLIFIIVFFVFYLYKNGKDIPKEENSKNKELRLENKNNLIKNLRYDVNFENGTSYNITSELSEIIYVENDEIVKMQKVTAVIINEGALPLLIKSDNAVFNNSSYNTSFNNNVLIDYMKNSIRSEKLFLDFENNIVTINNNIVYEGMNGKGEADNIKIDLKTKNVQIFMDKSGEKVKIKSK
mgnify:CR=1 FL=1